MEISGAQLDGAGAEREGRRNSASVGDPARGDHRHPDRIGDLREKREQAYGFRRVGAEEAAGVTARLESLRDHGIDAALGQPLRLGDRGGAAEDDRAGGFDAVKQRSVGQAEMEADDLGAKLLDDGAHRLVEGQAKRTAAIRLDAEFIIIGLEQCPPRRVVRRFGHSVTEEVEVDRPARPRPDLGDLVAHLIRREQSAWQRAKPAALNRRNRQPHAGSAGHGRGDDRMLDLYEIEEAVVGPARGHRPYLGDCGSIFTVSGTGSRLSASRAALPIGPWGSRSVARCQ